MFVNKALLYGLGDANADCEAALKQARTSSHPNWSPTDGGVYTIPATPFSKQIHSSPTCVDPTLSPAMAKACQCAGLDTVDGVLAKWIPPAKAPPDSTPPGNTTTTTPVAESSGGWTWLFLLGGLAWKFWPSDKRSAA